MTSDARNLLWEQYRKLVYWAARRVYRRNEVLRKRFCLEDAEQEAVLACLQAIDSYVDSTDCPKTYLVKCVTRHLDCLAFESGVIRVPRTSYRRNPDSAEIKRSAGVCQVGNWGLVPARQSRTESESRDRKEAVEAALRKMPAVYREALREHWGLNGGGPVSTKALAERLGVTQRAIQMRLHAGEARLRKILGGEA